MNRETFGGHLNRLLQLWNDGGPLVTSGLIFGGALTLHLTLRMLLGYLRHFTADSKARWDGVVLRAAEGPLRLGMWVVALYLLITVNKLGARWQPIALEVYDTALVLLLAWFLYRLVFFAEGMLLADADSHRSSREKATVYAIAKLLRVTVWIVSG
ncbi:MAG: hypothetical protein ACK5HY_12850, partial [Parahaliea sp.]